MWFTFFFKVWYHLVFKSVYSETVKEETSMRRMWLVCHLKQGAKKHTKLNRRTRVS